MTTLSHTRTAAGGIRRALLAALFSALLISAPLMFIAPAHADDTIGISARPAAADGNPDARTRFAYRADPGQKVDDFFLVTNTGTTPQDFTVLATDAFNDDSGDFALLPTADEPKLVGTWIHFENGSNRIQFSLDAGQSRLLPFSLDLPADATPGDHVGGLLASVVTPGQQVNLDRRVATRLYARVSGQLQPMLTISGISAAYEGDWWNPFTGRVTLHYLVDNTGNIALASNATATVSTWFGASATRPKGGGVKEILPGSAVAVDVELPGVAQWLYLNPGVRLRPFVDSQDVALQLPVSPVSRDTFVLAPPWTVLILIALAVLIVLFIRWRRRQDAARTHAWMEYTAQQAQQKAQRDKDAELAGAGKATDP